MKNTPEEPSWSSVAQPRRNPMEGTYDGAELATRSNRPGAYDAMALPSLFNGRPQVPGASLAGGQARYLPRARPASKASSVVAALGITPRSRALKDREYSAHPDSAPGRVISTLRQTQGYLTYAEICARFDVKPASVYGIFHRPVATGALVRHVIDGQTALALPSFQPAPPAVAAPAAPAPPPDPELLRRACAELEQRQAAVAVLQSFVQALKQRAAFDALQRRLRPLVPPLDSMPAF